MAIQANEIRIGNALYDRHGNIVYIHNGFFCQTGDMSHLKNYKPIPLTPEILEQCGFKKWDSVDNRFNHAEPYFDIEFENGLYHRIIWESREEVYEPFDTPFQYLHELQNKFYFATGKEIEIKLPATV